MGIRHLAFRLARSRPAGAIVRLMFGRVAGLVPLERLATTQQVALYRHPRPVYGSTHLLVVPLCGIRDIWALAEDRYRELRSNIWHQTELWRARYEAPWMLINAGERQDVFQVHFHLSDVCPPDIDVSGETFGTWELALGDIAQFGQDVRCEGGFGLLCGPDGRVHLATTRQPTN